MRGKLNSELPPQGRHSALSLENPSFREARSMGRKEPGRASRGMNVATVGYAMVTFGTLPMTRVPVPKTSDSRTPGNEGR